MFFLWLIASILVLGTLGALIPSFLRAPKGLSLNRDSINVEIARERETELGYIALVSAFDDRRTASRAGAVLALVGVVNLPIIHFSVEWWNTLHQGPTITKFDQPSIAISMLIPLLLAAEQGRLHVDDVYMPITPMFHVHAWGLPYVATMLGLKQIYPGRYEPEKLLSLIESEGVTFSHCVPTILHMLLRMPREEENLRVRPIPRR